MYTRFTLILMLIICSISFAQVPTSITYQGVLTDTAGSPVADGLNTIDFSLFPQATGGQSFWSDYYVVETKDGVFSVELGSGQIPITAMPVGGAWLEISLWQIPLVPRQKINSTAYSFQAGNADKLDNMDATEIAGMVTTPLTTAFSQINTSTSIVVEQSEFVNVVFTLWTSEPFTLAAASKVYYFAQTGGWIGNVGIYDVGSIRVNLINSTNSVVHSSIITRGSQPGGLNASAISGELPAGDYRIRVEASAVNIDGGYYQMQVGALAFPQ